MVTLITRTLYVVQVYVRVQCTLYKVDCTMYDVHFLLSGLTKSLFSGDTPMPDTCSIDCGYNVHCTIYTVHCTVYSVLRILYIPTLFSLN